ncbi:hypothetical protein [Seleniivibrio woodruffii]|uniref:hypothetical protein n=1 Tax=Seleniivibrio woodruffii TaxID=1078050 RepID=UPI002408F41E|nr:hypothetical protein [Seleniivibrio woodruffii]
MSEIRKILAFLLLFAVPAFAGDDDYILGLNTFADGIYSISAPALEAYLKDGQDTLKRNYAKYLLYKTYMKQGKTAEAQKYLRDIVDVEDGRFDRNQMAADNMALLTSGDCTKAVEFASGKPEDAVIDGYLNSKCPVDDAFIKTVLPKVKSENIRMKAVTKSADKPETVAKIFDATPLASLSPASKKYFGIYFYKQKDNARFDRVKTDYMDGDLAALELDRFWVKGDKAGYLDRFAAINAKYELSGAAVCRAIDLYNETGKQFDCNLVNKCMSDYSVDFVKIKGACFAEKKDAKGLTAFADSLGAKIFPGLCGYGEYIFANSLYTGEKESKFSDCENKFHIADIMLQKKSYKSLVNMFRGETDDMDRYYAAIGYAGLGKKKEAADTAAKIKDSYLKAKLAGVLK